MAEGMALEALLERTAAGLPPVDADRLATAVGDRLRHGDGPAAARWRRPLLIVAAAAAVIALVVAVVPSTRRAVADFLGIGAVRISTSPPTGGPVCRPRPRPRGHPRRRPGGGRLPVAGAPGARATEHPDSVHLRTLGTMQEVTLVYAPGPDRPASPVAPVGVLLSELRAEPDYAYVKKLLSAGTQLEFVSVGGADGVWISGTVHELVVEAPDGSDQAAPVRLATNTLLWADGGVTYRLEGALTRDQAIALGLRSANCVLRPGHEVERVLRGKGITHGRPRRRHPCRHGDRRHRCAPLAPPTSPSTAVASPRSARSSGRGHREVDADGLLVTPGLRRHPHPLRRPGHLGQPPRAVGVARRHHRRDGQLRRRASRRCAPPTTTASSS